MIVIWLSLLFESLLAACSSLALEFNKELTTLYIYNHIFDSRSLSESHPVPISDVFEGSTREICGAELGNIMLSSQHHAITTNHQHHPHYFYAVPVQSQGDGVFAAAPVVSQRPL